MVKYMSQSLNTSKKDLVEMIVHGKIINWNFAPNLRQADEVLKETKFDIKRMSGYGNINKKLKDLK